MRNPRIFFFAFIGTFALIFTPFTTTLALTYPAPPFPDSHPPSAVSATWNWGAGDDYFNIYVWRTNGHVWIEIEPIGKNPPGIMGGYFNIVQNSGQLSGIPYLQKSDGSIFYGPFLYVRTVFRLVELTFSIPPQPPLIDYVDDPVEFTLYYHAGNLQTYSLDVPAEDGDRDPAIAHIMANGSDGPIVVSTTTPVSISVTLAAGGYGGQNSDWWIAAQTPFGWFSYVYPSGWSAGVNLCAQIPLFNLSTPIELLNVNLPEGHYTFFFAVDDNTDGVPDATWLDLVEVYVQ